MSIKKIPILFCLLSLSSCSILDSKHIWTDSERDLVKLEQFAFSCNNAKVSAYVSACRRSDGALSEHLGPVTIEATLEFPQFYMEFCIKRKSAGEILARVIYNELEIISDGNNSVFDELLLSFKNDLFSKLSASTQQYDYAVEFVDIIKSFQQKHLPQRTL